MRDPFSLVYIYLIFAVVVFFYWTMLCVGGCVHRCCCCCCCCCMCHLNCIRVRACVPCRCVNICYFYSTHPMWTLRICMKCIHGTSVCSVSRLVWLAFARPQTHTHTRAQTGDTHSRSISVFLCIPQKGEQANLCNKNESAENKNLFYFMVTDINTFMWDYLQPPLIVIQFNEEFYRGFSFVFVFVFVCLLENVKFFHSFIQQCGAHFRSSTLW